MRLLSPLRLRISAISMNSGTVVSTKLFMLPQDTRPRLLSAGKPPCNSRYTNAGMVIANGTAIPAISRPRNSNVTMSSWSSGPMLHAWGSNEAPQTLRLGNDRAQQREAERDHAERHRQPRQPLWRRQIARSHVSEPPARHFEADELPSQQAASRERQQAEDKLRDRARPWRQP